jgi:two-component system nitrogen regulation sensor histidine kinase NtrY
MSIVPSPDALAPEATRAERAAATLVPPLAEPGRRDDHPATYIERDPRSRLRRLGDVLLGKVVTLVLAAVALVLGVATFMMMSGGLPQPRYTGWLGITVANLVVLLLLGAVLAGRLTRVWVDRRRGSAGSRLHVRLVMLFSVVAITPAIVVAVFTTAFFNMGIQTWFNDRVRTVLQESLEASRGYLEEHKQTIRADALSMANDVTRAGVLFAWNPEAFTQELWQQTAVRGLTEAVIFDPVTGQVVASAGVAAGMGASAPPQQAIDRARTGDVAVLSGDDSTRVRAVVQLESTPPLMLLISRPVDPQILDHMARTEQAVAEYNRLDQNRYGLQITFVAIFALVALLVLSAAVLIGLVMANTIARPIGRLILAAERVRAGDLEVRVPETLADDEVAGLSRAFNRMTGQLAAQRAELMDAYGQIDARRRFTETVLSGVSAGVIGLDVDGSVELPNRAASDLLGTDLNAAIGRQLSSIVPEFEALFAQAGHVPGAQVTAQVTAQVRTGAAVQHRVLLVRIGAELKGGRIDGYVVTFDDITELQSAQRKAAWADVARRIAHEIKNPLTPIQLSAERLKRRFSREITSDPETFVQCADTIVRHVGDIGRMVDEFSAFARMPGPVMGREDVGRIARDALVLQRTAHPDIQWLTDIPDHGPVAACDRRMLGQALTNLLQNAADAVSMRLAAEAAAMPIPAQRTPGAEPAVIRLAVREQDGEVWISVTDNGIGLPEQDRGRLTEPYVTHKPKGTGLGLAIVKKILDDHGGCIVLADRPEGPGAIVTLTFPARIAVSRAGEGADLQRVAGGAA